MNKEVKILLVEDNEGDIVLTLKALTDAKISNGVNVVKDGEAALQYLKKEGQYKDAETPDLILLDINLPKIDGIEVLAAIKNDEALKVIPVIMLSTSNSEKDILRSYQHHANCYIIKPMDLIKFIEAIQEIKNFWFSIMQLPKT